MKKKEIQLKYKKSYKLFNASYKEKEIVIKNDKNTIFQKVKSLFN